MNKKYNEPCVSLNLYVPQSRKEEIRELVRERLNGNDGWISVEDMLPPNNAKITIFTTNKVVIEDVLYFNYGSGEKLFFIQDRLSVDVKENLISHWILSPKRPNPPHPPKSK